MLNDALKPVTNEMVEAALVAHRKAVDRGCGHQSATSMRAALEAARQPVEPVAVKALLTSLHADLDAIEYHIQEHSFSLAIGLVSKCRFAIRSALAHPAPVPDLLDALTRTPAIEALVPSSIEWNSCETVQDRYDLMKRRIRVAFTIATRSTAGEE